MKYLKIITAIIYFLLLIACVQCQEKLSLLNTEQNEILTNADNSETQGETTSTLSTNKTIEQTTIKTLVPKKSTLICPDKDTRRPFFALSCTSSKECSILGKGLLCCDNRCIKGVPPPKPEPVHTPTLFGLVDRICPTELISEILEIKECKTDADCSPRICCPEKLLNGEISGFCRTAQPKLDKIPAAKQFFAPLKTLMGYMQCTPPPPPFLDVFPKPCRTPLDCFPNLCCQEKGKKYCRPPKRSLLTLVTGIAQRIIPTGAARQLIERITTK